MLQSVGFCFHSQERIGLIEGRVRGGADSGAGLRVSAARCLDNLLQLVGDVSPTLSGARSGNTEPGAIGAVARFQGASLIPVLIKVKLLRTKVPRRRTPEEQSRVCSWR